MPEKQNTTERLRGRVTARIAGEGLPLPDFRIRRFHDPEAVRFAGQGGGEVDTAGGEEAEHDVAALVGTPAERLLVVLLVPVVGDPLEYIAAHVIEAAGRRLKLSHRRGVFVVVGVALDGILGAGFLAAVVARA